MNWCDRPVRMMRLDYIDQLARLKDADLDLLARSKKEDWHINCEWLIGTPGVAPGLGHLTTFNTPRFEKYAPLGEFDLIREYLPHARKYGIKVLAYLNMHWFSYEFAGTHPGWEQVLSDGTPYGRLHPLYGTGTTLCVNSPWRDWAREMVSEVMKTGIDGVFLDGPVVYPGACHCEACREGFEKAFGADIPADEDWRDPRWKQFIEFREDSMAQFLSHCREATTAVNPDGVIFLNGGSWHAGAWRVARDIEKVGPFEDFNGSEAFFHPGPRPHVLHFWATAAKHLQAGGKPSVVFSHHALGSWHYIPLPPVETQAAIAQTVACGSNPWIAVFDYALDHSRALALEPVREIQGFLEKNEEFYTSTTSRASVALLFSRQSATYYLSGQENIYGARGSAQERDLIADISAGPNVEDLRKRKQACDEMHGNSYLGYFTALTREHIPFDVVLDGHLSDEGLSRYSALILPNAACLSDDQAAAVRRFVERGGGLVAEFETGAYDQLGERRPQNPLADVLGVESIDGAFPLSYGEEYVKVHAGHAALEKFQDGQLLARPPYSLRVRPSGGTETPMLFLEPIGQLYAPISEESTIPGMLTGRFGKGSIVYLPFLAGEFYARYRMWEYQALMAGCVRSVHAGEMQIEADCPSTVQVEVRQQRDSGRLLVHLVNLTGDMQRPMSEIIPVRDIHICLRAPGAKGVRALWSGRDLDITRSGEFCSFSVPEMGLYELIVVE